MKDLFDFGKSRSLTTRGMLTGGLILLMFAGAIVASQPEVYSCIRDSLRRNGSLAAWYVESGQLKKDVGSYWTQMEFLFVPESGAGARLDMDLSE
jgi:hypothetical protein